MTSRAEVRARTQDALLEATDAGSRVYTPLDWQTWDGEYPVLLVRAPQEDAESLGRAQPQFTVVGTIQVIGRIEAPADVADLGAMEAEGLTERLEGQIIRAVINGPGLMGPEGVLQQFPFRRTRMGVSAEGRQHLAEVTIDFGMEWYEGPEDHYPPPAAPLLDIRLNDPDVFEGLTGLEVEADVPIPQSP